MTKSADLQRLASLSDCVFAVAMTLLVFSIRIPDQGVDPAKLPGELTRMWNESYGLVLSFAITAMFWVAHFRLLRSLSRATARLIYLNLFQLFWIALLPISTSLLTESKSQNQKKGSFRLVLVTNLLGGFGAMANFYTDSHGERWGVMMQASNFFFLRCSPIPSAHWQNYRKSVPPAQAPY